MTVNVITGYVVKNLPHMEDDGTLSSSLEWHNIFADVCLELLHLLPLRHSGARWSPVIMLRHAHVLPSINAIGPSAQVSWQSHPCFQLVWRSLASRPPRGEPYTVQVTPVSTSDNLYLTAAVSITHVSQYNFHKQAKSAALTCFLIYRVILPSPIFMFSHWI